MLCRYVIKNITLKDIGICSVVFSPFDAKAINRRESFRVWLGYRAVANIHASRLSDNVIVKDLSTNGIGLVSKTDSNLKEGNTIHVIFKDETKDKKFNLTAQVVRINKIDEQKQIVGCKFPNTNGEIGKYVGQKQLEKRQNKSNGKVEKIIEDKDYLI